jgi:hypothetical protein
MNEAEKKIKEAVLIFDRLIRKGDFTDCPDVKMAFETARKILQQVLDAPVPKEKESHGAYTMGQPGAYNLALSDCRLLWVKRMLGLEEVIEGVISRRFINSINLSRIG